MMARCMPWLAAGVGFGIAVAAGYHEAWPALAVAVVGGIAGFLACERQTNEAALNSGIRTIEDLPMLTARQTAIEGEITRLTEERELQRAVFEVSAELVGCVDEADARIRFTAALRRWWEFTALDLLLWERGTWRAVGDGTVGTPPELDAQVRLPGEGGTALVLDLSAGVDGQAALLLHGAKPQPSLAGWPAEVHRRVADVLRCQLALSLRRVLLFSELQALARIDPLTSTCRRWYGERRLEELVEGGSVVAVVMADIDHFKRINDGFGHAAGDQVLAAVGRCLAGQLRGGDLACRLGGEEFLLIMPGTTSEGTLIAAERLRKAVAALTGLPDRITASFGIACVHQDESAKELIERADRALYQAKRAGRDRVTSAEMVIVDGGTIRTANRGTRAGPTKPE